MNEIFDLKNTSDLPEEIKKNLFPRSVKAKILELLGLKDSLSITELKVGLYRQYKLQLTNGCISVHLSLLKRKHLINNAARGIWAKV